jgi:hypothetical protein
MDGSDQKTFEAVVQREGKFTFVAIPFSPREVWGAKPRYYVTGTINDFAVRGTLGALGHYRRSIKIYWADSTEVVPMIIHSQALPSAQISS